MVIRRWRVRHTEGVPIACSSVIEAAGAVCQSLSLKAICADPGSAGIDEIAAGAEAGICMGELYCAASSACAKPELLEKEGAIPGAGAYM